MIVQSGINKVVYLKPGEQDPKKPKFNIYEASRKILNAALPPKYTIYKCINFQTHKFYREKDPIEETARKVIELMKSGIDNNATSRTDITEAFKSILEASLPSKYIIF